jgi:hypothetical protein
MKQTITWLQAKRGGIGFTALYILTLFIVVITFIPPICIIANAFLKVRPDRPLWAWIDAVSIMFVAGGSVMVLSMCHFHGQSSSLEKQLQDQERKRQWKELEWTTKHNQLIRLVENAAPSHKPGFIYLIRRSDGVMKLGCTNDLDRRIQFHETDYGMEFEIVRAWLVPDKSLYEIKALGLTGKFQYVEDDRKELRQMSDGDLARFIMTFDNVVEAGRGESEKKT